VPFPEGVTLHGPFSKRRARVEEHPGPPVSQTTSGMGAEEEEERRPDFLFSKNQKNKFLS